MFSSNKYWSDALVAGGTEGAMVEIKIAGLVEGIAALIIQNWLFVLGIILLISNNS